MRQRTTPEARKEAKINVFTKEELDEEADRSSSRYHVRHQGHCAEGFQEGGGVSMTLAARPTHGRGTVLEDLPDDSGVRAAMLRR